MVIHPGNACGSVDFSISRVEAKLGREAIALELDEDGCVGKVLDSAIWYEVDGTPKAKPLAMRY